MHRFVAEKRLDVGDLPKVIDRIKVVPCGKLTDLFFHSTAERNLDHFIQSSIRKGKNSLA